MSTKNKLVPKINSGMEISVYKFDTKQADTPPSSYNYQDLSGRRGNLGKYHNTYYA